MTAKKQVPRKTHHKRSRSKPHKKPVKCPYCSAQALLREADGFFETTYKNVTHLWVCANYPSCDSYVIAHNDPRKNNIPLGPLANGELRKKRAKAHSTFDMLWKRGVFSSRTQAYAWLSELFGAPYKQIHIGEMGGVMCDLIIQESSKVLERYTKPRSIRLK